LNQVHEEPGAVILGGLINSLGAARCLAGHGVKVCLLLGRPPSPAQYSRSVNQSAVWSVEPQHEDFPACLAEMAGRLGIRGWVLFPCSDPLLRIVSQHHALLSEHYVLTVPPWETTRFLYDKRLTCSLARETWVAIPRTHVPGNADRLAVLDIDFPVILKPAISQRLVRTFKKKAFRAGSRKELQNLYEIMARAIGSSEVIVQELLPDPARNLFSFAGYFRDGEPIVGLSAKRTRQFPREFGMHSTFVEVVDVPELGQLAGQLLRAVRYTGLAEVEFMWDAKQARFKLLEVNARLWGWHSLAVAAGLDLPYVAFADALGKNPSLGTPRKGTKWVRLLTDGRSAVQGIRAGTLSVRQYLASLRGVTAFAVFSISDPVPFIVQPFLILFRRVRRRLSRKTPTSATPHSQRGP